MGRAASREEKGLPTGSLFGFSCLLAANPLTSPAELGVPLGHQEPLVMLSLFVAFAVGFCGAMAAGGLLGRRVSSMFARRSVVPASLACALIGIALHATGAAAGIFPALAWIGSLVRGVGTAGLFVAWIEIFTGIEATARRLATVFPRLLIAGVLLGLLTWLVGQRTTIAYALIVAALSITSFILLYRARYTSSSLLRPTSRRLAAIEMPRSTRLVIFAFGLALGSIWAILAHASPFATAPWVTGGFCALSLVFLLGFQTYIPRYDLQFGMALRTVTLMVMLSLLAMPVLMPTLPGPCALLLSFAWAAIVILLEILVVHISSSLPVNPLSVASSGGTAYSVGMVVGALASGIALGCAPLPLGYSIVTALTCATLSLITLWYPSRKSDASLMGIAAIPENETRPQMLERRTEEVGIRHGLTAREIEILRLLVAGKSRSHIAATLGIGEETVRTHIKHVYEKTGVHSLRELVVLVELGSDVGPARADKAPANGRGSA